jgi:hypothetical protein
MLTRVQYARVGLGVVCLAGAFAGCGSAGEEVLAGGSGSPTEQALVDEAPESATAVADSTPQVFARLRIGVEQRAVSAATVPILTPVANPGPDNSDLPPPASEPDYHVVDCAREAEVLGVSLPQTADGQHLSCLRFVDPADEVSPGEPKPGAFRELTIFIAPAGVDPLELNLIQMTRLGGIVVIVATGGNVNNQDLAVLTPLLDDPSRGQVPLYVDGQAGRLVRMAPDRILAEWQSSSPRTNLHVTADMTEGELLSWIERHWHP